MSSLGHGSEVSVQLIIWPYVFWGESSTHYFTTKSNYEAPVIASVLLSDLRVAWEVFWIWKQVGFVFKLFF